MTPATIDCIIKAAELRIAKGAADNRDVVIVALYSALNIEQAKAKSLREELDKEQAANAQSAASIAGLTTRLAMSKAMH